MPHPIHQITGPGSHGHKPLPPLTSPFFKCSPTAKLNRLHIHILLRTDREEKTNGTRKSRLLPESGAAVRWTAEDMLPGGHETSVPPT